MRFKSKFLMPAGEYVAEFVGHDEIETSYGPSVVWKWVIVDGKYEGKEVGRVTGDEATGKNACGAMLEAVTGQRYPRCLDNETDDFIGRRYKIGVGETTNGSTRVIEAKMLPDAIPEPPQRPVMAAETVAAGQTAVSPSADEIPF